LVPQWVRDMYGKKGVSRKEWRELERIGEAESWVRGVGESGGEDGAKEWVDMMWRLVKKAEERGVSDDGAIEDSEQGKTRL